MANRRSTRLPALILLAGLIVFAAFSVACWVFYVQAEQRALDQRTKEASAVLAVSVSQIQAPLDSAATLAQLTDGDPQAFQRAMSPYVGTDKTFSSAVLYVIDSTTPRASVGDPVVLDDAGDQRVAEFVARAPQQTFAVADLLDEGRHLGYGVAATGDDSRFVVYGERTLSPDPNVRRRNDEAFAQLKYAIYLGTDEADAHLLGSSERDLPLQGRRATAVSDFGDNQLLLVMSPTGHLSSVLFAQMWWVIALIGLVASFTVAALSRRLIGRHNEAIALADDNERLYDEQRQIAETLQLSLLPQVLEPPPGAAVAARYWPAGTASLIGGDFYDVFRVDESRWAVTIGDVCGKGIEAAAVTGLARHTVRAAARHFSSPSEVLRSVHQAMSDHRPSTFCTVCFVFIEALPDGSRRLTMSLGGHPPALLRRADGSVTEVGELGTLLGLVDPILVDVTVDVQPGDTLVLYTDGLTDAPAEQAVSIDEVRSLVQSHNADDVEQMADAIRTLKRSRRPRGSGDDTVVLIVGFGDPTPTVEHPEHARSVSA